MTRFRLIRARFGVKFNAVYTKRIAACIRLRLSSQNPVRFRKLRATGIIIRI